MKKKSLDFLVVLFVDLKRGFGGSFELKRLGFGVKMIGIIDFNGNNRVIIGMNIFFGNRCLGLCFGFCFIVNFKFFWNNVDY